MKWTQLTQKQEDAQIAKTEKSSLHFGEQRKQCHDGKGRDEEVWPTDHRKRKENFGSLPGS